jgi:hypothetical protein
MIVSCVLDNTRTFPMLWRGNHLNLALHDDEFNLWFVKTFHAQLKGHLYCK